MQNLRTLTAPARAKSCHAIASAPALRGRSVVARAAGTFPGTLREVDEMKRYCGVKVRAELQKKHPNVLKACLLMSLEEEAEIFQIQAEGFEKLQVEGQIDVSGVYKIAHDRVREAWTMLVREARRELVEDVDRGFIRSSAKDVNPRYTYSTDLLADDILGAFVHALDPAEPLTMPATGRPSPASLAAHPDMPKLLQKHAAIFLHAASDVLFNRHGLKHWTGRDTPDAFLMHRILTSGRGAPIALAVLCQAVCHRAGVSLGVAVTDGGSQCVTWPQGSSPGGRSCISVNGVPLVFDLASHGTISMEEEYKQYLEVNELVPSQERELLFALLSGLLECHWQHAFGSRSLWGRTSVVSCLQLALRPRTEAPRPYHLTQALVVAKRCLQLMPHHAESHLYYGALLYLSKQYARCLKHLDLVADAISRSGDTGAGAGPRAPPCDAPQARRGGGSGARPDSLRWLSADDVVLLRPPARSTGASCARAQPAGRRATGGAAIAEPMPARAPPAALALMPRPRWGHVAAQQGAATGGAKPAGRGGGGGGSGRGDSDGGGDAGPGLSLDAPLPLDTGIFTPQVIADVAVLRQKARLTLQPW
eukprot:jgi/Ulvmu1/3859/UM018_0078.1